MAMGETPEGSSEALGTYDERQAALLKAQRDDRASAEAEDRLIVGADFTDTKAMRAELAARGIGPASEESQMTMSLKFNERLEYMFPGVKRSRSWMSFFNHLDEDGSGHVQYGELLQMVRKELKLTADDMPEDSVKALWLALDVDNSNHVTPGEFGVMIMRGVSHKLEGTAEKRAQQNIDDNKAKIKASEEAEKLLVGTNLMKTADLRKDLLERSVPPLEQPELMAMSLIFNRELEYMFPGVDRNRSWKSMFNRVDADNTGYITYYELEHVLRKEMDIAPAGLSVDNLKGLWCALDRDDSNKVEAAEFANFMMLAVPKEVVDGVMARRSEENRQKALAKQAALEAAERKRNGANLTKTAVLRADLVQQGVAEPTDEEKYELSAKFNKHLEWLYPGNERSRSWMNIFKAVDKDGSGLITYLELSDMVRKQMKIPVTEMSEKGLTSLWCCLDIDNSNVLEQAEFGRFISLAGPTHSPEGRAEARAEAVRQASLAKIAKEEAEASLLNGAITAKMQTLNIREELAALGIQPATVEEQVELSGILNTALEVLYPNNTRVWTQLFKNMAKENGTVEFDELEVILRKDMKLAESELADTKLKSLWCALDADASNHVTHEEFGRFMNLAGPSHSMEGMYEKRAEAIRQAKRAKALELEAMEAKLNGADKTNTAQIRSMLTNLAVPPLNDADIEGLSLKFNVQLEYMLPGNDRSRSWMTMFEEVDKDKSGLITYNELERMVRDKLKLTAREDLSSAALQALWCWIDSDDSNSVQPAEFGKFMKLAAPPAVVTGAAAKRAEEHRRQIAEKALADLEARKLLAGYVPTTRDILNELEAADMPQFSEEDQLHMSIKYNDSLEHLKPAKGQTKSWLTLFKMVDVDDSGSISFDELVAITRNLLKLSKAEMPEVRIKALWVTLDVDGSNVISTQEFGRFMRKGNRQKRTTTSKVKARDIPPPSKGRAKPIPPLPGSNKPTGAFAQALLQGGNPVAPPEVQLEHLWPSRKIESRARSKSPGRSRSPPSVPSAAGADLHGMGSPPRDAQRRGSPPRASPAVDLAPIGRGFQSPRPTVFTMPRTASPTGVPKRPVSALDREYERILAAHHFSPRKDYAAYTSSSSTPRTPSPTALPPATRRGPHSARAHVPFRPISAAAGHHDARSPYSRGARATTATRTGRAPSSPRPTTASPRVGPRRETRASYQASVWSMQDAEPPNFRAVGSVERDYMHGIDMYRRMCDHAIQRIDRATGFPERDKADVSNAQHFGEFMKLKQSPARMTGKGERLPS